MALGHAVLRNKHPFNMRCSGARLDAQLLPHLLMSVSSFDAKELADISPSNLASSDGNSSLKQIPTYNRTSWLRHQADVLCACV
jgi:hypothetical protein